MKYTLALLCTGSFGTYSQVLGLFFYDQKFAKHTVRSASAWVEERGSHTALSHTLHAIHTPLHVDSDQLRTDLAVHREPLSSEKITPHAPAPNDGPWRTTSLLPPLSGKVSVHKKLCLNKICSAVCSRHWYTFWAF